jgi:hypothetical protein
LIKGSNLPAPSRSLTRRYRRIICCISFSSSTVEVRSIILISDFLEQVTFRVSHDGYPWRSYLMSSRFFEDEERPSNMRVALPSVDSTDPAMISLAFKMCGRAVARFSLLCFLDPPTCQRAFCLTNLRVASSLCGLSMKATNPNSLPGAGSGLMTAEVPKILPLG